MKPADLCFDRLALRSSGDVRLRWLGAAGFEIEHDGWVLLIDPYLSRPSLPRCLLTSLRPDIMRIRAHVDRADAIVVGHTHFDHALDVPAIARLTGAKVLGSRSAMALCRAHGLADDRLVGVQPDGPGDAPRFHVGPFDLQFTLSAHSPALAGRVPLPGDIDGQERQPLRARDYRCGVVLGVTVTVAGRRLHHMGSANLRDDVSLPTREVDLLLMCASRWAATPRLPQRVLRQLSPGAILLSHWDDFFRPLDVPARALPALGLATLVDALQHQSRQLPVGTLPVLGELVL